GQAKDAVWDEFTVNGVFAKNIKTAKFGCINDSYLKIANTTQVTDYLLKLVSDYLQMKTVYLPAPVLNELKTEYRTEHDYKLKFKPLRHKIHAFADVDLYKNDPYLQNKYLEKCDELIKKNTYDELPKLIDLEFADNALEMYEKRFLALYYFTMGLNK
ncbi:MAG: hypothetical protein L3J52_05825, partial [Proteobacteria bacterium]|nr:hypothetical protein [Pseudomonadota bacterium]